ncbi:hypothetical protein ACA910_000476 [Epithemia clementina (nom. ined.)]
MVYRSNSFRSRSTRSLFSSQKQGPPQPPLTQDLGCCDSPSRRSVKPAAPAFVTPSTSPTLQRIATTPVKKSLSHIGRRRRVTSETDAGTSSPYSKSSFSSSSTYSGSSSTPSSPLPTTQSPTNNRNVLRTTSDHAPNSPPSLHNSTYPRRRRTTSATDEELAGVNSCLDKKDENQDSCSSLHENVKIPRCASLGCDHDNSKTTRSRNKCSAGFEETQWDSSIHTSKQRAAIEVIDGSSEIVANVVRENDFHRKESGSKTIRRQQCRSLQYSSREEEKEFDGNQYGRRLRKMVSHHAAALHKELEEKRCLQYHLDLSSQYELGGDLVSSWNILEQAIHAISVDDRAGGCYSKLVIDTPLRRAYLLYRSGLLLWKLGCYVPSMERLSQARDMHEQVPPQEHKRIYFSKTHEHNCLDSVVAEAVGVGRGSWSETMTEIYMALGKVSLSMGDPQQGKRYLIKALRILELDSLLLEEDKSEYSTHLQCLQAKVLRQVGSIFVATMEASHTTSRKLERASKKAGMVLYEALRLHKASLKEEARSHNVDYALTLSTLGQYHETQGDYENAAIMYLDALDIFRACSRNESSSLHYSLFPEPSSCCRVDMGVTLARIGWLYYLNKEYDEARNVYQEAFDLIFPVLGSRCGHTNIASLHLKIGMIYMATHQWPRAMKRYKAALDIQRQVHPGDNHESIAQTLCLIATCYAEEEEQFRDTSHSTFTNPAFNGRRNLEKALQFLDHALGIRIRLFGRGSLPAARTLVTMGRLQHRLAQARHAVDSIRWALEIYSSNGLDASHTLVMEARSVFQRT